MFSLVTRNYTSRRVIGFGSDWIDLNRYPYPVTFIRFRFGSDRLWIFESPIHMRLSDLALATTQLGLSMDLIRIGLT